jgi:hypothetical protein
MRPSRARTALWAVLIGAIGLFVAGCYTVLVHPQVEDTTADNSTQMCSDCHSSADYNYWHFPYQNSWYSHSRYWNSYYYDPWWYDDYWYWHGGDRGDRGGGGGTAGPERKLWQPRTPPGGEPSIAPGTSGNAGSGNKSSESGSGSSGGEKNKTDEKKTLWQPRTPPGGSEGKQPEKPPEKPPGNPPEQKTEDQK